MMITPSQATTVLESLVLFAMACFIWRGYTRWRLDLFREQLFTIRAELFDYAAEGNISFDSQSYVMLRRMLNGFLRFGHNIDGVPFLTFMLTLSVQKGEPAPGSFVTQWRLAAIHLDPDQRTTLENILRKMHVAVVEQAVLSSLLLTIVGSIGFVSGTCAAVAQRATKRLRAPFGRFYARHSEQIDNRLLRRLDDIAFEEGLLAA